MGKIGILTHYDVNNQGAQLQLFATHNLLKECNIDAVALTYAKNFDFNREAKTRNQISLKSIPYIIKKFLIEKGIRLTYFNTKKYLINKKFRIKNIKHENYAINDCDAIIIGSDECFSLESGCNMMMYGHSCSTKNIIIYAPSFGQTDMSEIEKFNCRKLISSGLKSIKYLSVRDEHTMEMVKELTERDDIMKVCDPALLYDFAQQSSKVKLPKKDYLLIYGYDKNFTDKEEIKNIKNFAKLHNLKTVSAGTFHKWCDYNFNCNCIEWLEYFRNAKFIITDTFHGTIASLISGKPIAIYIRNKLNNNKLNGLINQFNLDNAKINEISLSELERVYIDNIDYSEFNELLDTEREKSKGFLMGAINEYIK